MSAFRFFPVFNPPVPEAKCAFLGENIAKNFSQLDDLAEDHDLTPLTSFADNREVPLEFDENVEDLDPYTTPWEEWFDCTEGMDSFGGLARMLREDIALQRRLPEAALIAQELEDWAQMLIIAQGRGAQFRLELSET